MTLSPELAALRDEAMLVSCEAWAIQKRWPLSPGIDRSGPCPVCGGKDRFSIHTKKNVFNCRVCGISGEGSIALVMETEKVEFIRACEIITGRRASDPIDARRAAQLRAQAEADQKKRDDAAAIYRENARREAYALWMEGRSLEESAGQPVGDYLAIRGIDLDLLGRACNVHRADLKSLRCHPEMAWTESVDDPEHGTKTWSTLHIGPAMLAAIQMPDGHFGGVHITWLDLGQPKGRLMLPPDAKGKPRPTKKVRGVKKGGAIRLFGPSPSGQGGQPVVGRGGFHRIVMGEGIESTATPMLHAFEAGTAYWAGVDVGNMGGKALRVDGRQVHDQPDMDDVDCFLPPDWCDELVYLGEGDDAEVHSAEKCMRGLRRAKRLRAAARDAGVDAALLSTVYVPGEAGKDMNDLAMAEMAEEGLAAD